MNWAKILNEIFKLVIIPFLGILTTYFVKWVRAKIDHYKAGQEDTVYYKYLNMFEDTVARCVEMTNQTYVNALKNKNAFTAEAQKEAFQLTYNSVITVLSEDAKQYLTAVVGDFDLFTKTYIESLVNEKKTPVVG